MDFIHVLYLQGLRINGHFLFPDQGKGTLCRTSIQINNGTLLNKEDRDQEGSLKQFDPMPMSYDRLLPLLLNSSLVQLREVKAPPTPLPPDYNVNVNCEYHSGTPAHSIEDCKSLKYNVQDLIDSRAIMFTLQGPNIMNAPLPPQEGIFAMS